MMPPGAVGNGQTRPISPPPGTPPRALHAEAPWAVTNAVYANVPASFGPLPTLSPPANWLAPGTPMAIQEVKPLATAKAKANVSRVFPGIRHGGDTLLDTFVPRHRANSSSQTVVGNHAPAATQKQQPQQHVDLVPAYPDDPQPQQHVDLVPAYPDDPQPAKAYIDAATVADVKQQAEARRAQDATATLVDNPAPAATATVGDNPAPAASPTVVDNPAPAATQVEVGNLAPAATPPAVEEAALVDFLDMTGLDFYFGPDSVVPVPEEPAIDQSIPPAVDNLTVLPFFGTNVDAIPGDNASTVLPVDTAGTFRRGGHGLHDFIHASEPLVPGDVDAFVDTLDGNLSDSPSFIHPGTAEAWLRMNLPPAAITNIPVQGGTGRSGMGRGEGRR